MANSMQMVINCSWLQSICSHGSCTGKLPRVIHFSWFHRYVHRLPFHRPFFFVSPLFPFTFIISRMLMYSAARVEAGIYHFLITFYKWIWGYLHRGSVTATLDMKSWLSLCRYGRSRLSERPSALQQLAALTANAAEGITGRQGGKLY